MMIYQYKQNTTILSIITLIIYHYLNNHSQIQILTIIIFIFNQSLIKYILNLINKFSINNLA